MKTRITTLIAALLCLAVLSPAGVSAAGYQNIGGYAGPSTEFFTTRRYISNPSSPGPEVAFYQYSGPAGLFLGTWGCPGGAGGGPMYKQSIGSWQPVGYYSSPDSFCLFSYSNSGSGNFNGDLSWD